MKWTKEDIDFLTNNYKNPNFWELCPKFIPHRTKSSVLGQVRFLGLKLSKQEYSDRKSVTSRKYAPLSKGYRGYKDMGGAYIASLRNHAKNRNLDHTLLDGSMDNNAYLYQLFTGFCQLSGLEIAFKKYQKNINNVASFDRINPNFGYIKGNVQWVHKEVNELKWDLNNEEFLAFVKDIYNFSIVKNEQ
jgi:hypothetical protein